MTFADAACVLGAALVLVAMMVWLEVTLLYRARQDIRIARSHRIWGARACQISWQQGGSCARNGFCTSVNNLGGHSIVRELSNLAHTQAAPTIICRQAAFILLYRKKIHSGPVLLYNTPFRQN